MSQHNLLHDGADELGVIRVFDDGQYRILSFADGDEQSRMRISTPHVLQHDYTQAMALSLLFCQPKRVCILGLGGGTLVNAIYHAVPSVQITAVELRQEVLDVAEMYFKLPKGKRVHLELADAGEYIQQGLDKKVDLLMTDIYNTQGMDQQVLQSQFIENCARNIKDNGWLVLNCWNDCRNNDDLYDLLKSHFADIRGLDTGTGNWIIFAGKTANTTSNKELKNTSNKLSQKLDIPLNKWLSRLTPI
ncbi:spermidine synthase [Marinomonas sp.]|nr:spermidine synthase [Marinomonas sp.]MDB4837097.1 spermidine synthase [Marinomonas sp.]